MTHTPEDLKDIWILTNI